ncbi:FimV/HubP family polar landmark protein [Nitrosomonas sp.]|uniref:FimV/HubP family polar landmark protein n=1 Tax=Nitrosomonas sp. TaxID=42353 RepID=UPI0025D38337|nr:FimV/HubP family polar landmark protein [Nitrosomonas sp.]
MFVIILMLPAAIYAAGLGKLTLNSALGQPLNAEIDIVTASSDEVPTLKASIATREAFAQAGISYESVLSTVRVSVESRINGNPYVKLTSPQAVNDPFLMVLIELSWSSGKILREYTVLLDPVESTAQNFAAASASPATQITTSRLEADKATETKGDFKPAARARGRDNARTYGPVSRGDTLSSIARRVLPPGVNLNQMLVALHRANRDAFIANNMNLLKAGAILNIPDQDEIAAIDTATASAEIKMQTNDWRQYQAKLATASRESSTTHTVSQSDQGQITTTIDKKSMAADAPKEVLKLSSGTQLDKDDQAADSSLVDRLRMMEEDAIARNLALKEANERVAMLEKSIANLKHLLELKDSVLAQAQVNAESLPAGTLKPEAQSPIAIDLPAETKIEPETHSLPPQPEHGEIAQSPQEAMTAVSPVPLPVEEEQSPGLIELLFEYMEYIAGASILLLLSMLLIIRRRKKQFEDDDEEGIKKEGFSSTMRSRMAGMAGASAAAASAAADDDEPLAASDSGDEELTYENINSFPETADREDDFDHGDTGFVEHEASDEGTTDLIAEVTDDESGADPLLEEQPLNSALVEEAPEDDSEPIESVSVASATDFSNEIDFDLDTGSEEETKRALSQSSEEDEVSQLAEDTGSLDYSLDVVAADAASDDDSIRAATTDADANQDEIILEFDSASLDLDGENSPISKADSLQSDESDLISDAIDFEQPETASESAPEIPAVDLADINLDLEEPNQAESVEQAADLETNSEQWQEVETKLDLAKAYQEMDDKEGAREMLEEVIRDGDAKQIKIAKKMLKSL